MTWYIYSHWKGTELKKPKQNQTSVAIVCYQCTSLVKNYFGIQKVIRISVNKFQLKYKTCTKEQIVCYGVQLKLRAYHKSQKHTFPKQMLSRKYQTKITFQQKMSLEHRKIPALLGHSCRRKLVNSHHKPQLLLWTQPITIMPGWWREEQDYFRLLYVTNSSVLQIKWNKVLHCIWCNKVILLPPSSPDEAIRNEHFSLTAAASFDQNCSVFLVTVNLKEEVFLGDGTDMYHPLW